MSQPDVTVNLSELKEAFRRGLPPTSQVLQDLFSEPDVMPVETAAVLVPHYVRRLRRELRPQPLS